MDNETLAPFWDYEKIGSLIRDYADNFVAFSSEMDSLVQAIVIAGGAYDHCCFSAIRAQRSILWDMCLLIANRPSNENAVLLLLHRDVEWLSLAMAGACVSFVEAQGIAEAEGLEWAVLFDAALLRLKGLWETSIKITGEFKEWAWKQDLSPAYKYTSQIDNLSTRLAIIYEQQTKREVYVSGLQIEYGLSDEGVLKIIRKLEEEKAIRTQSGKTRRYDRVNDAEDLEKIRARLANPQRQKFFR